VAALAPGNCNGGGGGGGEPFCFRFAFIGAARVDFKVIFAGRTPVRFRFALDEPLALARFAAAGFAVAFARARLAMARHYGRGRANDAIGVSRVKFFARAAYRAGGG
jgi:hypothetical protein